MKIRLTQHGFDHYNGQMGVVFFVDGLSTADVTNNDARRMAATMLCEWEDGTSASISQSILDNAHTEAPVYQVGAAQHDQDASRTQQAAALAADKPKTSTYSREQLSAIADKDGIKGLRALAEPLGIKGTAIRELIDALMQKQHGSRDTPDFT